MVIQGKIEAKIKTKVKTLNPEFVELINESHNHSVPRNSETHFKLLLVSPIFVGMARVQRQRKVYDLLAEELKNGVHALTMRLLTPEEYSLEKSKAESDFVSPSCHGGSK
jgi:stress-induced morphogen